MAVYNLIKVPLMLLYVIGCVQVKERRCQVVPRAVAGPQVSVDKCRVEVGEAACSEVILQLPRQRCPARVVTQY